MKNILVPMIWLVKYLNFLMSLKNEKWKKPKKENEELK